MNPIINDLSSFLKKSPNLSTPLGNFHVGKQLGQGGTSIVRLATYEDTECEYAIKFLLENVSKKESKAYKRFKQAYVNLVNVQHIGVTLPLINFGILEVSDLLSIPYVIMRKADSTLDKYVEEKGRDFDFFKKVFDALTHAVAKIHKSGIIHRDIKPENIFIVDGKMFIGDFDIASFDSDQLVKLHETLKKERIANFFYSAPEQSEPEVGEISEASDWFAVGQVLLWVIRGTTSRGNDPLYLVSIDSRYRIYQLIIEKLIARNPNNRFQSLPAIIDFMKENDEQHQENIRRSKNVTALNLFDRIIYKYMSDLGMSRAAIRKIDDPEEVEDILTYLHTSLNALDLYMTQGIPDWHVSKMTKLDASWIFEFYEVNVKAIWISKHFASGGSFLAIESDSLHPSGNYETAQSYEEVGVYKDIYIKREEYDAGWARINGKLVDVSGSEILCRYLEPTLFFIAPWAGPLSVRENADLLNKVREKYDEQKTIAEEDFIDPGKITRRSEIRIWD
ncbi:MAG: protein kinase [Marinospirillum sp.]|uniref:protein kinase domain-containing protein n=1 Tax=Marinospirillum sp. TaxID=2183934 RepID=UPI0019FC7BE7|nr:protein kinase [Marinospirillum sp.]MBE0507710.1 protein kinase [Marinospirillum sp.]